MTDELEVGPDIQRHLDVLEKWTDRDLLKLIQMQFLHSEGKSLQVCWDCLARKLQNWISEFWLNKSQQHALAGMMARPTLGSKSSSIIEGIH